MKIDVFNKQNNKVETIDLSEKVFGVRWNSDLVHQALLTQLANSRAPLAHTKGRGEVRGGGRKPYKQKHTGRARQGSIRAPHFKGGGVTFGPRNVRNFVKDMPKKQRRLALFSALSEKARNNEIIALEDYKTERPRTKDFAAMLKKLPIKRNVLVIIPEKDPSIQKSSKNIAFAKTILASYANIHDLQKYGSILLLKKTVEKMKETFLTTPASAGASHKSSRLPASGVEAKPNKVK
ncbi:MAG: 50S ribosomal protein L4 [Patescibacteria group bacterium]